MKLLTCFTTGTSLSVKTSLLLCKTPDASFSLVSSHGSTCRHKILR